MMKKNLKTSIFIAFWCSLLIFSCGGQKRVSIEKQRSSSTTDSNENWQIQHRIPDCDSALVFMDNILVPISSKLPLKEKGFDRGTIQIYIPGESNSFYRDEKYKLYINPDCLEGVSSEIIFRVFCTKDSYEKFVEIDKLYRKDGLEWGIEISSRNGFGMGIKIVNGISEKVYLSGTTIESK